MEEKLVLIGQAKEAEERRNQDMRRYADDRERHVRQQAEMVCLPACVWMLNRHLKNCASALRINKYGLICGYQESLAAQLSTRENEMEGWRKERDALVSALEVQLKKLIMSNAEKDKQIQILQSTNTPQTPEVSSVLVTG